MFITQNAIITDRSVKITIRDESVRRATLRHNVIISIVPFLGLIGAMVSLWTWGISFWQLILMVSMFGLLTTGVEVGIHRYFAHKSFEAAPGVRIILAILGSMAWQGPVVYWAANHRLHHTYTDGQNDPHSPRHGFWHAHMGWFFEHETPNTAYLTADLLRDPILFKINRLYLLWIALGCTVPTLIGWGIGGTWQGAMNGFLWGGLVPVFLVHHAMFSVNSICHSFGRQPFRTNDESRNNIWLSLPTFGLAWHNNHHAFPSSARLGLKWWQIDIGGWIIQALKGLRLAWNVKTPTKQSIEEKMRREISV